MFLVVMKKTIVDQPFVAEVIEDLNVDPPIAAAAEIPLVTHDEVAGTYIEEDAAQVAMNLEADDNGTGRGFDYYQLQFNGAQLQATLHPVTLTPGPRSAAPAREVAEIQANGQDVGSAIVEA